MSPVSVVVPACDAESTIERTVQSLLGQEYPLGRFEVIVVENGSRDRTPSLLASGTRRDTLLNGNHSSFSMSPAIASGSTFGA